jgi:hypothetical protein
MANMLSQAIFVINKVLPIVVTNIIETYKIFMTMFVENLL